MSLLKLSLPQAFGAAVSRLGAICTAQDDAQDRLRVVRTVLGVAIIRLALHAPKGRLVERLEENLSTRPAVTLWKKECDADSSCPTAVPRGSGASFELLRWVAIASVGFWSYGSDGLVLRGLANLSFLGLQIRLLRVHRSLWSYNAHLNLFLGALSLISKDGRLPSGRRLRAEEASAVVASLQLYYATVYLQSGLSKLRGAGVRWVDGRTLRGAWAELGTAAGRQLARRGRWLAAVVSCATLFAELSSLPILVGFWRYRTIYGLVSLAFHLGVKYTMQISFWHLAWFAVPLFVLPPSAIRVLVSRYSVLSRRNSTGPYLSHRRKNED